MALPSPEQATGALDQISHVKERIWRFPLPVTNGASSVAIDYPGFAANSLVNAFDLTVTAAQVTWAAVSNVGQVRQSQIAGSASAVVVDFGTLQTVSGVAVLDGSLRVFRVTPWNGVKFDTTQPIYLAFSPDGNSVPASVHDISPPEPSTTVVSQFASEVRTERIQIELLGTVNLDDVAVGLPAPPADLDLRVNGGPPVWSFGGAVQAGSGPWTGDPPTATVSIADALNKLAGRPDDASTSTLHIVLSARVPGALQLSVAHVDLAFLQSVAAPDGKIDLAYDAEGLGPPPGIRLALPANAQSIGRVDFTTVAALPPERVIQPVGEPPSADAHLLLDADHAAVVRLPPSSGLHEMTGVRLPLRADATDSPTGAEVRVTLLADPADGGPGDPLPGAVSHPVTLPAAPDDGSDGWVTLRFPKPVPLADDQHPPWAALLVTRGKATWTLDRALPSLPVRRGPPAGPWRALPTMFDSGQVLGGLGGRARLIGTPKPDAPIAPLRVNVLVGGATLGDDLPVTPTAKGVPASWSPAALTALGGDKTIGLRIESYVAGDVTVRDLVVLVYTPKDDATQTFQQPAAPTRRV